ncbi:hypothetical protein C0993_001695 [Termitomyces sp. T159_Od127]|nr:hypothetical protein C0993_001695 [Termitomyces sp. T159_Od127]
MSSTGDDPFQLSRLADELATRESAASARGPDEHNFPAYVPLSHDNPFLADPNFNVEQFLLSRSNTSLPELRSELREYLSQLKEELVKLINDDYEAFISLSTDLKDEGDRLVRLQSPLGEIKSQILQSRTELQAIQDAIQEKLAKRAVLREEKALLQLLLKLSDSVTRLESLLLIASPETESPDVKPMTLPSHLDNADDSTESRPRGNRAKHLARVAAEYVQLSYHASKARSEKCIFVDQLQWRIDRIRSTISSDLDHVFAVALVSLTDGKGEGKPLSDVTECLKTYDLLGLWRDAEDVIKKEVVRAFVKKHYEFSHAFIRSLEYLAPSVHSITAMRAHPTYIAFQQRWQLPVYFQMRWKEIVGSLEESLSVARIEPSKG